VLDRIARLILDRVPQVLRGAQRASHTAACPRNYGEGAGCEDRAWRLKIESLEAYCILNEDSERELLRLIVGGAPRRRLSAIERRITGEAVCQLLGFERKDGELAEVRRERPGARTWCSSIEISPSDKPGATLEFFIPFSSKPACSQPPSLAGVALPLRALLSSGTCDLGSVMKWKSGTLVRLRRGIEVNPIVFAGGRRIAEGQLGSLHGERVLMLTNVWGRG
jgi:hypothetical protein